MKSRDRSSHLRAPRSLRPWLIAEDYHAALMAADVELVPNGAEAALAEAAAAIDTALGVLQLPGPVSLLGVAQDLKVVGKRGAVALRRHLPGLPEVLASADPVTALTALLAQSDRTVIVALLDAASADVGGEGAAAAMAEAILTNGSLRRWAEASRAQYMAGAIRERRSDVRAHAHLPGDRDLGQALCWALIGTFGALTGRTPGVSRVKPEVDGAGEPSGPLVRFLIELYRCLRVRPEADLATHDLAREMMWSPSPETLARWSTAYRRDQAPSYN